MPFTHAFSTRNANASIHGPVSRRGRDRIPGMIPPSRPSAVPFDQIQAIRAERKQGARYVDLSRKYGYAQSLVRAWCEYTQRVFA